MTRRAIWALVLALLTVLAGPGAAVELEVPRNAQATASRDSDSDSYAAPIAPFADGKVPIVAVEGEVRRRAYRIASPGLTPLQVLAPLRAQLLAAGYDVRLDCAARECGGFDFRFAVETLPAPGMYVNLRAFRFLTATRGPFDAPDEVVTVLASTAPTVAHVQIVQASRLADNDTARPVPTTPATEDAADAAVSVSDDLGARLLRDGAVVLDTVAFSSGTDELGPGASDQLAELAGVLRARPNMRIALVGHTDSVGGFEPNLALSRRRAAAVRARLIADHGVAPGQVEAEGVAYLAPVASNLTKQGRDANRRVEAVFLSDEQP